MKNLGKFSLQFLNIRRKAPLCPRPLKKLEDYMLEMKVLDDGRIVIITPQLFNMLLTVSSPESYMLGVYDDGW